MVKPKELGFQGLTEVTIISFGCLKSIIVELVYRQQRARDLFQL